MPLWPVVDCGGLLGFSVFLLRVIRWPAKGNVMHTTSGLGGRLAQTNRTEVQPGKRGNSFRTAGVTQTANAAAMGCCGSERRGLHC